jgi:Tol biopolymer transport system component
MNQKKILFLVAFIGVLLTASGFQTSPEYKILFEKAKFTMETKGDLNGAINLFNDIIKKYPKEREYAAKSQLYIGLCYEKLGVAEARKAFERVVREYADQSETVAQARVRLAVLSSPGDKKGFVTRRILTEASGIGEHLTADGKYIIGLNRQKGDVSRFEIASGQTSQIKNKGPWGEMDMESMGTALSRDGKQIVFDSYTKDWAPQLLIRNLDGSEVRTLYSEKDYYAYPFDWSPDGGSIIAMRNRNDTTDLIQISTSNGFVRVLKAIPSQMFMFERAGFSPDGRFVAFSFIRDGNPPHGDLFLLTLDDRNEIVVAGHPAEDNFLGWTPDGKNLLFLSDRSGTWDIWTVRITGGKQQGEPELLKKDFGYYSEVLGIAQEGSFYYKVNTPSGGLYNGAIDLETGKILSSPSPVATRYTGPPYNLAWSPDGKYLLYLSRRGSIGPGNNLITIRSNTTGEERILKPYLRFVNQMSWAPDGRSILAVGITEKEAGIFQIETETGSIIRRLVGLNRLAPRLCPDGNTLVYMKGGPMAITKHNLDTGEESEVIRNASLSYDISPDGKEAVFFKDSVIITVPLIGGEPKKLIGGLAKYYNLKWTKDGRYIIAEAQPSGMQTNEDSKIWRIPAKGGAPLKLDLSVPNMLSFALHPDNSRFMMSVNGETKSELWVMENFLQK